MTLTALAGNQSGRTAAGTPTDPVELLPPGMIGITGTYGAGVVGAVAAGVLGAAGATGCVASGVIVNVPASVGSVYVPDPEPVPGV